MSANELIERLRTLATKEHGFGMRYDNSGFSPSLRLYGKRAVAAYWLLSNGHTAADLLASQAAEIERLMEAMVAGDYLIDRLDALSLKKPVRDLCEARAAYQLAKVRAEAAQALKGTGADHG